MQRFKLAIKNGMRQACLGLQMKLDLMEIQFQATGNSGDSKSTV